MVEILSDKHDLKKIYFAIGFLIVFAIMFSFQYLSNKIPGLKDNYLALFCANINS